MTEISFLKDAYDIHVHASPDIIPRAMDLGQLRQEAEKAGMAGILIKDHCTSTVGRVAALNSLDGGNCRFFSALALNPPVGGINPTAAEAALKAGVDVVYFPTYGAVNHIRLWGAGKPPTAFPLPNNGLEGIGILDQKGTLKSEVSNILKLIAEHQAVLATGHISAQEALVLLKQACEHGIKRLLVTHASASVSTFSEEQQSEAIQLGAWVEHSFFAATPSCPNPVSLENMRDMIRSAGVSHVILSSDFGQPANGNPVANFGRYLEKMEGLGFSPVEIRQMISTNPQKLLLG